MNVIVENQQREPVSVVEAAEWRDTLELSFEVLADVDQTWVADYGDPDGGLWVQHSYVVVTPDGRVAYHEFDRDQDTVDNLIEAVLAVPSAEQ